MEASIEVPFVSLRGQDSILIFQFSLLTLHGEFV